MQDEPYREIPLRARDGSLKGVTKVSPEDFDWLSRWAWRRTSNGYARRKIKVDGKEINVAMHREVVGLSDGDPRQVDHVNRDRLDNRRGNLRIVTQGENGQNREPYPTGTSRFRGVSYDRSRGRWRAQGEHLGVTFSRRFRSETEAAEAAAAWRRENLPFAID